MSHLLPDSPVVVIGRPLPNVTCYILDSEMQPVSPFVTQGRADVDTQQVPVGVRGVMYVGGFDGACLSRGYRQRPELTAKVFVPNPFQREVGDGPRIYRTGDIAQWLPNGTVQVCWESGSACYRC